MRWIWVLAVVLAVSAAAMRTSVGAAQRAARPTPLREGEVLDLSMATSFAWSTRGARTATVRVAIDGDRGPCVVRLDGAELARLDVSEVYALDAEEQVSGPCRGTIALRDGEVLLDVLRSFADAGDPADGSVFLFQRDARRRAVLATSGYRDARGLDSSHTWQRGRGSDASIAAARIACEGLTELGAIRRAWGRLARLRATDEEREPCAARFDTALRAALSACTSDAAGLACRAGAILEARESATEFAPERRAPLENALGAERRRLQATARAQFSALPPLTRETTALFRAAAAPLVMDIAGFSILDHANCGDEDAQLRDLLELADVYDRCATDASPRCVREIEEAERHAGR